MNIENLIEKGCSFVIREYQSPRGVISVVPSYFVDNPDGYTEWQQLTIRFLQLNYPNDPQTTTFTEYCNKEINPSYHRKLVGILKSVAALPVPVPVQQQELITPPLNLNINNSNEQHQTQQQSQKITIEAIIEQIEKDLTSDQLSEIKQILQTENVPERRNQKVVEKLLSFGENVCSNVLAGIICMGILS